MKKKRYLKRGVITVDYEEENDFQPLSQRLISTVENMCDDELKKEMIRQVMSELGKRSAEARAKKRQNIDETKG